MWDMIHVGYDLCGRRYEFTTVIDVFPSRSHQLYHRVMQRCEMQQCVMQRCVMQQCTIVL